MGRPPQRSKGGEGRRRRPSGDMSGGGRPVLEADRRIDEPPAERPYDGSSTIGVFDCTDRLFATTIATPTQATAMPSHIVAVGGTP